MSSKHIIRDVKEDFDWESYVSENYDVKRAYGKHGLELRICCPSCGETNHKCYINPERSAFFCFRCSFRTGKDYDLFDFVAVTEGITKGQALIRLIKEYKPVAPEDGNTPWDSESEVDDGTSAGSKIILPEMRTLDGLPERCYPLVPEDGNPFWEYVKSRGFTEGMLRATNLHYAPSRFLPIYDSEGKLRGNLGKRIVFPVYGPNGQLVSWLGRTVDGEHVDDVEGSGGRSVPKYFNCPESDLSRTLWPFSPPYNATAILVEGIIDALGVRQVQGTSAYATFGKRISREQIQVLKHWGVEEVVLWYDKKDARKEMINEVKRLKMHFKEVYVLDLSDWPVDKDPGSFLSDIQGTAMIKDTLDKRISTYSLEYERWKTAF